MKNGRKDCLNRYRPITLASHGPRELRETGKIAGTRIQNRRVGDCTICKNTKGNQLCAPGLRPAAPSQLRAPASNLPSKIRLDDRIVETPIRIASSAASSPARCARPRRVRNPPFASLCRLADRPVRIPAPNGARCRPRRPPISAASETVMTVPRGRGTHLSGRHAAPPG